MKLYVVIDCMDNYPEEIYYSFDEFDAKSQAHIVWNDLDKDSKINRNIRVYAYEIDNKYAEYDPEEVYWSYVCDSLLRSELVLYFCYEK